MIIIGHQYIDSPPFFRVKILHTIEQTLANSVIVIENLYEKMDIIEFAKRNNLLFAIEIESLKEALLAQALGSSYVICDLDLAKEVQVLANEYLWDMKVLVAISKESELEVVAKAFIDGVIYKNYIKDL